MTILDLPRSLADLAEGEQWRLLTTQPQKFGYFREDSHFRESWDTAVESVGTMAPWLFQRLAVLTVRPEAVLTRKIAGCVDFMTRHGFVPIHARRFSYHRTMTRELWRYQWNVATLDRLALGDRIHSRAEALTLFFVDTTWPLEIPASSRLASLKGSAFPSARTPAHLRSILGAPNRILVLVHCPDEPMDIVRELGVVFDRHELASLYPLLLARADSATKARLDSEVDALYSRHERHPLCVESAVAELLDRLDRTAAGDALRAARQGEHLAWAPWRRDLRACGVDDGSWPVLLAATQHILHDIPGATCLLSSTGRKLWMAGEGRVVA